MCGFVVKPKYHPITLYSFLLLLELEGSTWEREAAQLWFLLSEENAELPPPRKLSFSVNLIITLCSQEYSVCRAARQALFFLSFFFFIKKPPSVFMLPWPAQLKVKTALLRRTV